MAEICHPANIVESEVQRAKTGPHPKMPSLPPVNELMAFDAELRSIETIASLHDIVEGIDFGPYWNDWALMLASYRAKKLGDNQVMQEYANRTFFTGDED